MESVCMSVSDTMNTDMFPSSNVTVEDVADPLLGDAYGYGYSVSDFESPLMSTELPSPNSQQHPGYSMTSNGSDAFDVNIGNIWSREEASSIWNNNGDTSSVEDKLDISLKFVKDECDASSSHYLSPMTVVTDDKSRGICPVLSLDDAAREFTASHDDNSICGDDDRSPSSYSNILEPEDDDEVVDICDHSSANVQSYVTSTEYSPVSNQDSEDDNDSNVYSPLRRQNRFGMTVEEAVDYVESKFAKVSKDPPAHLTHRQKIEFILKLTTFKQYTVEEILHFDRKVKETALKCARICDPIKQQYRWNQVDPYDIPNPFTICMDSKKGDRINAPRPMNGFMIWSQSVRRLCNVLCPKIQNANSSAAFGIVWGEKPDVYKHYFEQQKDRLKVFHQIEFPGYKYQPQSKAEKAKNKKKNTDAKELVGKGKKRRNSSSSSVDGDQLCQHPPAKRAKPGRPKKQVCVSTTRTDRGFINLSSPTKNTKDKLTLKIRDRLLKVVSPPPSQIQTANVTYMGVLSPPEHMCSEVTDLFQHEQSQLPSTHHFDTPSNTPPVDEKPSSPLLKVQNPCISAMLSKPARFAGAAATIQGVAGPATSHATKVRHLSAPSSKTFTVQTARVVPFTVAAKPCFSAGAPLASSRLVRSDATSSGAPIPIRRGMLVPASVANMTSVQLVSGSSSLQTVCIPVGTVINGSITTSPSSARMFTLARSVSVPSVASVSGSTVVRNMNVVRNAVPAATAGFKQLGPNATASFKQLAPNATASFKQLAPNVSGSNTNMPTNIIVKGGIIVQPAPFRQSVQVQPNSTHVTDIVPVGGSDDLSLDDDLASISADALPPLMGEDWGARYMQSLSDTDGQVKQELW